MIDLRSLYGSIFKIILDESAAVSGLSRADKLWLYQIPCRFGHIYVHGTDRLGAYCHGRQRIKPLLDIPGVTLHQRGDSEVSVTFAPEALPLVADLLKARRRRVLSDSHKEMLRKRLAALPRRDAP